ncbi:MAG: Do family serine endopeptidase [Terricaulis silvestris]
MKIDRAKLLKAAPWLALIAGFAGGIFTMGPLAAQERANSGPPIQIVQAAPLQRMSPANQSQVQLSFAPVAARASPAVVNVYAERVVRQNVGIFNDPFFGRFGGGGIPQEFVQRSLGSGVIVRADGIIVTNNHVIDGAQSLKVVLADRREFPAELVLADARVDLAVLRIHAGNEQLPTLPFADTHQLQVGDLVLAIGNPFGLNQTVTSGIVSALARTEVGASDYAFFIQTDAAINRGNSGGALVDMSGALVGINSAIYSEGGGSNGIGFAIPSEMVRRVVESAVSGGQRVIRPWLGVKAQTVTSDLARSMGMARPEGAIITDVYPNSSGARAGLQRGDVIVSVAGEEIRDEAGVRYQFATQNPGTRVPLDVLRNGRHLAIAATAEAPPGGAPQASVVSGRNPLNGARVVTLTPATAEDAGLDPFKTGVFIQAIDQTGIAAQAGFQPGDIISTVNGSTVRNAADLNGMLAGGNNWIIGVERNGQSAQIRFGF